MAKGEQKPSEWIVQRMATLDRQSREWPEWKQQDLKERLTAEQPHLEAGSKERKR